MKSAKTLIIKEQISVDLSLRDSADIFFNNLDLLSFSHIVIDFTGVKSISRSFAHEYLTRKNESTKEISEIHVPENVRKMFQVVEHPNEKTMIVDFKKVKVVSL